MHLQGQWRLAAQMEARQAAYGGGAPAGSPAGGQEGIQVTLELQPASDKVRVCLDPAEPHQQAPPPPPQQPANGAGAGGGGGDAEMLPQIPAAIPPGILPEELGAELGGVGPADVSMASADGASPGGSLLGQLLGVSSGATSGGLPAAVANGHAAHPNPGGGGGGGDAAAAAANGGGGYTEAGLQALHEEILRFAQEVIAAREVAYLWTQREWFCVGACGQVLGVRMSVR